MAAGFRSPFFIWVGGLSAPGGSGPEPPEPPDPGCPCTEYNREGTLVNSWLVNTCEAAKASLPFTIPMFRLYRFGYEPQLYKQTATLSKQFTRKGCM
jgi:hypothetical protein